MFGSFFFYFIFFFKFGLPWWLRPHMGLIPGSGRSLGEGNGYPLQYSCLENPIDRGAWRAISPWGPKKWDMTEQHFHFHIVTLVLFCVVGFSNFELYINGIILYIFFCDLLLSISKYYVQFTVAQLCPTLCNPMDCSTQPSLSITNSQSLLKFMSIKLVMPSNLLILCRPLVLLPSIFPSIRVFSSVSVLHIRWPKYWSFRFSISASNEYSGLISFRMNWFDLLAVQGTLKSLLQHHSSKVSVLQYSAFFIVQFSHPYMNDYWKNHSFDCMYLCRQSNISAF